MPASFKVTQTAGEAGAVEEHLDPDFGESAIGRVAPVDSGVGGGGGEWKGLAVCG